MTKPVLKKWGLRTAKEWFGDRVVRVQMPDGNRFKLASLGENYLSFELFWRGTGYYEPITTLVLQELLKPDDTFIDVGANIGFYSLVLSVSRPQVRVVSFEPNPKNYKLLAQNARANGFAQITCEPVAISDRNGVAELFLSASDMSASLQSGFDDHVTGRTQVRTSTLDSYLAAKPPSGNVTIKVDVEGHEEAFFRGAQKTLAALRPDIITEVTLNYSAEALALLKRLGYRFYQITDQGLLQSDAIFPVVHDRFVFLNYLLSAKPPQEIASVFNRIAQRVRQIDLTQTSKFLDAEALEKFKTRAGVSTEHADDGRTLSEAPACAGSR